MREDIKSVNKKVEDVSEEMKLSEERIIAKITTLI